MIYYFYLQVNNYLVDDNMTEKMTDHLMMTEYYKVFNKHYHTEGNNKLFGTKLPDGWDILQVNNNPEDKKEILIVIEDKRQKTYYKKGLKQLQEYINNVISQGKFKGEIIPILGFGETKETFKYYIFSLDDENKLIRTCEQLQDIKERLDYKPLITEKQIHDLNQYIYDNGIPLSKSQKTLFIASILICLKINSKFPIDNEDKGKTIALRMIETINNYYSDKAFTDNFQFLVQFLQNEHLKHFFKILKEDVSIYGKDVLNRFYSEFCIWDKNNDAKSGVVLTPDDVVQMMVDELQIKPTDKICDFCTGTGSFLIKCGNYSQNLYGCENNVERYSLAKCNFILHDLDYKNLSYNSCFSNKYEEGTFDKVIINPPFSCEGDKTEYNTEFTEEKKFMEFGIKLLKPGGIGCFIIPRGNFNSGKINKKFKEMLLKTCRILKTISCNEKVFSPVASVACTIITIQKLPSGETGKEEQEIITVDYSQDGYDVLKNVRIKTSEKNIKSKTKIINPTNDWNYEKDYEGVDNLHKLIAEYNNLYNCFVNDTKIKNGDYKLGYKPVINYEDIKPFKFTIGELLEEIKGKVIVARYSGKGNYPLISSSSVNNGVIKYIDKYIYDIDEPVITIANSGSSGYSFVQSGKFSRTGHINIYKLKQNINPHLVALLLTDKLTKLFNYNHGAIWERIKDLIIELREEDIN